MIARSDITDAEYVFLASQKIPLSHIFDARGRGATSWGEDAKREGSLFGLASECFQGHRLRTRAGHCIQCDTSKIAFIRRDSAPGFVYVAASKAMKLLKVGCCIDIEQRERKLNYDQYGGANDWEVIAWCKTTAMGEVEFDIHRQLADISIEIPYVKNGRSQVARELFKYEIARVWQAYRGRVERMDEKSKWKHPKLQSFAKL